MRVSLKNDVLTVGLSKPEVKKVEDAEELCRKISILSPLDERVQGAAREAQLNLRSILGLCVKVSKPRPLLDIAEKAEKEREEEK
ncbi:MAG TPA: hypothetical protein VM537_13430 [Anaerolineae bacterium]|nr:hypothetical protein [Anaerolineae bacterium]